MRFAVFLCYSVRYLRVFLCGFAVLVPHLRPLQTLLFLTRLPTRQDGVENRDNKMPRKEILVCLQNKSTPNVNV